MKIAIITDVHYGARSDNLIFLDYTKKFLDEIFFPYIDEYNITRLFMLGDLVDRRKYINYYTANRLRIDFLDEIAKRNLDSYFIAGNHDLTYKSTSQINIFDELITGKYTTINIYTEPGEVDIDGIPILLVPWINAENREQTLKLIKKTKAQICFGHLDLTGFEMHRGVMKQDGDSPTLFDKFDVVCSGHFHHMSARGNIHYLGAPLQFDWNDYNDPKGFHIFDTETRELEFIENPFVIFKKLWYNDKEKSIDEVVTKFDFDAYAGCFCKLIIEEKVNPYWFDLFVEKLEAAGVSNLQIVEDHKNLDLETDLDIISDAEDTFTIFRKAIEGMDDKIDKNGLVQVISELYQEAMSME
jgi:DNA repair exonuclease SbcCD nuclease subunit